MAKIFRVRVTKDDIESGIPENTRFCPIAKAIRRLGSKKRIKVNPTYISIGQTLYFTPLRAAMFIDLFDQGRPVNPISFSLRKDY